MKVLHVITGMARAAGTSVFCGEVLRQLSEMGHSCRLLVRHKGADFHSVGTKVRVFERGMRSVLADGWRPQIVHIHALWSPWLLCAYVWARTHGVPVVWSPHGMLTPWALSQGCPVVTTRETPWRNLEEHRCGWWIDVGVPALTQTLRRVFSLSENELTEGGEKGLFSRSKVLRMACDWALARSGVWSCTYDWWRSGGFV